MTPSREVMVAVGRVRLGRGDGRRERKRGREEERVGERRLWSSPNFPLRLFLTSAELPPSSLLALSDLSLSLSLYSLPHFFWRSFNMSFWSEACLHLRRAVPRPAAASRIRLPQSRRCLHSAQTAGIAGARRTSLLTRDTAAWGTRQSWQGLKAARPFSVTARAGHGNLTPPKPGEE